MASRDLPIVGTLLVWGLCLTAGLECSPKVERARSAMQELARRPVRSLSDRTPGPGLFHGTLSNPKHPATTDKRLMNLELEAEGDRVELVAWAMTSAPGTQVWISGCRIGDLITPCDDQGVSMILPGRRSELSRQLLANTTDMDPSRVFLGLFGFFVAMVIAAGPLATPPRRS